MMCYVKLDIDVISTQLLDIEPDEGHLDYLGKPYRWFKLGFSDTHTGWVRDDLLDVIGDLTFAGYGIVATRSFVFNLYRDPTVVFPSVQPPTPPAQPPVQPGLPAPVMVRAPAGVCTGTVHTSGLAKIRSAPTVTSSVVAQLLPGSTVKIVGVTPGQDADHLE